MKDEIRLLQFFICKEFEAHGQDRYTASAIHANLYVPEFPCFLERTYVVTCWRKDSRFHKEVIEYTTAAGVSVKSSHMDIEPVTDSVIFRWHKHEFPGDFAIEKPTTLAVRVALDGRAVFESCLMIEKTP